MSDREVKLLQELNDTYLLSVSRWRERAEAAEEEVEKLQAELADIEWGERPYE